MRETTSHFFPAKFPFYTCITIEYYHTHTHIIIVIYNIIMIMTTEPFGISIEMEST